MKKTVWAGLLGLASGALFVACASSGKETQGDDSAAAGAGGASSAGQAGVAGASGAGAGGASGGAGAGGAPLSDEEIYDLAKPKKSCAYSCPDVAKCAESSAPYVCQNVAPWAETPHVSTCPAWSGAFPAVKGKCTASAPTGEAARFAGPIPGGHVLPDGRRVMPSGEWLIFSEKELPGGLTSFLSMVPKTTLALTIDTGMGVHAVRAVETSALSANAAAVRGTLPFPEPSVLSSSLVVAANGRLLIGSGDGKVYGAKLDLATGKLDRDAARDIPLPESTSGGNPSAYYVASLALSGDEKRLAVTGAADQRVLIFDVDPASASYGKELGRVSLGGAEVFAAAFGPDDPAGSKLYLTRWDKRSLVEIDVTSPSSPVLARTFPTPKDPESIAFLDARWVVVSTSLGDALVVVDRTGGGTTVVPVEIPKGLPGLEPAGLAYDAAAKRLWVALAGINAVAAYDVDLSSEPPKLTLAGRLPTLWWPGGVGVRDDGAVVIASMRGVGSGPSLEPWAIGDNDIGDRMRGALQVVAAPTSKTLADGDAVALSSLAVSSLPGQPTVTCPDGADDFPIPSTNTAGPSKQIKKIFFIVRENKGFDGVFGDLPGVNGDPKLTLKTKPADQEAIWKNLRSLARAFTVSDNYYTDAVYSTQGHVWTTHGRTSDFNERTWTVSGAGRDARPIPGGGVIDVGQPEEGSLFDWLGKNKVPTTLLGEINGSPQKGSFDVSPSDVLYPGGPFQNIGYNDLEKACYTAGRLRVRCDLGSFVYMTLPNDHTFGASSKNPTPEVFCAVNDEATGMILDAITHSPSWGESLVFITEDDPSQGGEHVDSHRTPLVVVSPWIKRGYVSSTHIDVGSIHKIAAHVLGLPYPNVHVANAALPLDMFTSTPDFAPYTYTPRTIPLECGKAATKAESELTDSWDMDDADEQPGLDAQVARWMRGRQWTVLPPRVAAAVERRKLAKD